LFKPSTGFEDQTGHQPRKHSQIGKAAKIAVFSTLCDFTDDLAGRPSESLPWDDNILELTEAEGENRTGTHDKRSSVMVLIPVPVFWQHYTATAHGSGVKMVPCENCSTEYVYILQREVSGTSSGLFPLGGQGTADRAKAAADDTLKDILENDFDPVPCPVCGHYQRYMFPKMVESKGLGLLIIRLILLASGCFVALGSVRYTIAYVQNPNEESPTPLVVAWSIALLLGLISLGLSLRESYRFRNFDPNRQDQQTRIALGRNRAITWAEFEKVRMDQMQQPNQVVQNNGVFSKEKPCH
jgi:hypothetical protein